MWLCCALCSDKPNWGSQTTQGSSPTKMAPPGAIAFSWWPHNSKFTMVYDTQITIVMGFLLTNKHNWGVRHFSLWGVVVRRGTFRWKLGSEWRLRALWLHLRAHWLLALTPNFCWLVQSVQSQFLCQFPCFMRIVCMQWHAMSLWFMSLWFVGPLFQKQKSMQNIFSIRIWVRWSQIDDQFEEVVLNHLYV